MSYQPCNEMVVKNAARFMAEAGCDAIKLEGGNAGEVILSRLKNYHDEVKNQVFPDSENTFGMPDEEFEELKKILDSLKRSAFSQIINTDN